MMAADLSQQFQTLCGYPNSFTLNVGKGDHFSRRKAKVDIVFEIIDELSADSEAHEVTI